MGKTLQVAADRAYDQSKTVLPAEVARGVYMRNAPSLRALKLMHLMISTAGGRMAQDVRHEMRLSDIRRIEGMAHHDRESLKPL
ncbi:RepB family plasmid replication initiator protein, partial [Paracoccus salipaludis]